MKNLFVVVSNDSTWEDIAIIITEKQAIEESMKHPELRIEIFEKVGSKYKPTYNYYKNGELILNNT